MVMQLGDVLAEATPQEATSDEQIQPAGDEQATPAAERGRTEDTAAVAAAQAEERLAGMVQQQIAGLEQRFANHYAGVQRQTERELKTMRAENAELKDLLKLVAEGSVDPDRLAALTAQREKAAQEEQVATLQAELEAAKRSQPSDAQSDDAIFVSVVLPQINDYAAEHGVTITTELGAQMPKSLTASPRDPRGFGRWLREAMKVVDAEADRLEQAKAEAPKPRPRIDTARGTGGGNADKELLRRASQPSVALSPQELARVRDLHTQGVYS